jgi:3-hydroxybutyrate dehydrogenase
MLKGKVAVITGSTSGIGLAIAIAIAHEGAHVVLNGLPNETAVGDAKARVLEASKKGKVLFHAADMTKPYEVVDLITFATGQLGSIDILVNNAGTQYTSPLEQFPQSKWDEILAINLSAAFHTIKASLPSMKENGWGRIINIASVHGLVASEHKSAYVAAKHGLVGLTKVVALETAETGITCNAICPGWVRTALAEKQIEAMARKKGISEDKAAVQLLEEKQPSKQFVQVEDLAKLALFLCSDAAAGITGSTIPIDGGWTAR